MSANVEVNEFKHAHLVHGVSALEYYQYRVASHVMLHTPWNPRAGPLPPPSVLQAALRGRVVKCGVVELNGRSFRASTHPSDDCVRIAASTQVSYSDTESVRYHPCSIGAGAGAKDDESLRERLRAKHEASAGVEATVLGAKVSLLLSAQKGSGIKTLLQCVCRRPLLELLPGRLLSSSSSATAPNKATTASAMSSLSNSLRSFFVQASLPLHENSILYLGDLEALYADPECERVLTEFLRHQAPHLSRNRNDSLIVVGRVVSFEFGPFKNVQLRNVWYQKLEVPLPSFQTRFDLVKAIILNQKKCIELQGKEHVDDEANEEEQVSIANSLAGLGLAEAVDIAVARVQEQQQQRRLVLLQQQTPSKLRSRPRPSPPMAPQISLLDALEDVLVVPRKILMRWPKLADPSIRGLPRLTYTGVLLHGPPGTGKTLLVRRLARLASERHSHRLLTLRLVDVVRGEVGAGERAIAAVFQEAKRVAPAIVFIDEFQALFVSRSSEARGGDGADVDDKSLSSALAGCFDDVEQWNLNAGASSLITVFAATNEPWAIDEGFLRIGRFDKVVFVGPLSDEDRASYLQQLLEQEKEYAVGSSDDLVVADIDNDARTYDETEATTSANPSASSTNERARASASASAQQALISTLLTKTRGFSGADMELLAIRAQQLVDSSTESEPESNSAISANSDSDTRDKRPALESALLAASDSITPTSSLNEISSYAAWHSSWSRLH